MVHWERHSSTMATHNWTLNIGGSIWVGIPLQVPHRRQAQRAQLHDIWAANRPNRNNRHCTTWEINKRKFLMSNNGRTAVVQKANTNACQSLGAEIAAHQTENMSLSVQIVPTIHHRWRIRPLGLSIIANISNIEWEIEFHFQSDNCLATDNVEASKSCHK